MKPLEITFFINNVSHHIDPLLNALAERADVAQVTLVTDGPVTPDRIELGWAPALTGHYRYIEAPDDQAIRRLIGESAANAVNIFVGMRHYRTLVTGINACLTQRRRFGLMHEPRVREGWRGALRFMQSWLTEGAIRRNAFVLAIGAHGPGWFRGTGYKSDRIFPFAYFVAQPRNDSDLRLPEGKVRLGYVGRLERAKDVLEMLQAAPHIAGDFMLSIVGTGSEVEACRALAARDPRVAYLGVLPSHAMDAHMRTLDILIQPSRTTDDGWGVVVSEALLNGAAVICSELTGASACLAEAWRGCVVPPYKPEEITRAVANIIDNGVLDQANRNRRAEWAAHHLTGKAGSRYLMEILTHLSDGTTRPPSFLDQ